MVEVTTTSLSMPEPDIAVLALDLPGKGDNVLSRCVLAELDSRLGALEHRENLAGLIITSRKPGMFVAGADCLAVDAVAAYLMGFDPWEIPHLRLAGEGAGGCIDLQAISTEPAKLDSLVNPFKPAPTELSVEYPGIVVHDCDSCSACLSTVVMLLERYHSQLLDYAGPDRKFHIALGKSLTDIPPGTVLIGNCAAAKKAQGLFVKGCPPVPSDILEAIKNAPKQDRR